MKTTIYLIVLFLLHIFFLESVNSQTTQEPSLFYNGTAAWSPNGQLLVFTSNRSGNFDIWTVGADGSNLTNLTNSRGITETNPQWSPDGRFISFRSDRSGLFKIWVMETTSHESYTVGSKIPGIHGLHSWSLDGKHVAIAVNHREKIKSDIWVVSPDGENPLNLTENEELSFNWPVWSPDGKSIAFVSMQTGDTIYDTMFEGGFSGIWMGNIVTKNVGPVNTEQPYMTATWTPGNMILATVWIAENVNVWRIDPNSGASINITEDEPTIATWPAWSPDGTQIAFVSRRDGQSNIWVMDANGKNSRNLTLALETRCVTPVWSPDGKMIAFETSYGSVFDQISDILVINVETLETQNLTSQSG